MYSSRVLSALGLAAWLVGNPCTSQADDVVPPSPAPVAAEIVTATAKSWPLGRGDALAQGVAKTSLPDKPEIVWKVEIEKGAFEATPVIADGVVYLGDMDGKVYAWNLADGKEIWTYKVASGFMASPAIRGGLLYIGDIDGKFYALDIKTGQPKWTFAAESEIENCLLPCSS
jgi:outer membrane protein assembly factor BamB